MLKKRPGRPPLTEEQRKQRKEGNLQFTNPEKKRKRDQEDVEEFLKEQGLTSEQMHLVGLGQSITPPTAPSISTTLEDITNESNINELNINEFNINEPNINEFNINESSINVINTNAAITDSEQAQTLEQLHFSDMDMGSDNASVGGSVGGSVSIDEERIATFPSLNRKKKAPAEIWETYGRQLVNMYLASIAASKTTLELNSPVEPPAPHGCACRRKIRHVNLYLLLTTTTMAIHHCSCRMLYTGS